MINPYLIFNTKKAADLAIEILSDVAGTRNQVAKDLSTGIEIVISSQFDIPKERLDGTWCFAKPDDKYLEYIIWNNIEEYSPFWFITEEEFNSLLF